MLKKTIGFLGAGNMGSAIIKGLAEKNAADICVYDPNFAQVSFLVKQYGVFLKASAEDLVSDCDVLVIAIKPQLFDKVLPQIREYLKPKTLVVSIAAGKKIADIESLLGKQSIARVMPNVAASIGEAISAICLNDVAGDEDRVMVTEIFSAIGQTIEIEENLFSVFSAIGGCSPAFTAMYIDALATAGVRAGLSKDAALKIATQAVYGTAKLLKQTGEHPAVLVDKVCSPGGTTIEGVATLKMYNFDATVMAAVQASTEKDKKI